ncbi:MAG: 5-formyltetrahydrofolate cyclo-ligase [Hydrogenovibrio sp.]|nr:5-formyltetrahydrofolate cyclo-ligase [Hydrogenovibrio sp.]
MHSQSSLRKLCRQKRNQLDKKTQQRHAKSATLRLLRSPILQRAKRVSVFLTRDGELETRWLVQALWQRKIEVYLPVLTRYAPQPMRFARYTPNTRLQPNVFDIPEPQIGKRRLIAGHQLDVVITPLACFDHLGNRIGMGGGYYDRTFRFKLGFFDPRPSLVGWAHQCQQVSELPRQPWDIPLNAIVTEERIRFFRHTAPH